MLYALQHIRRLLTEIGQTQNFWYASTSTHAWDKGITNDPRPGFLGNLIGQNKACFGQNTVHQNDRRFT